MLDTYILFHHSLYAFTIKTGPVLYILAARRKQAAKTLAAPQNITGPIHPYLSNKAPATGFPIKSPKAPNPKLIPICVPTSAKSGDKVASAGPVIETKVPEMNPNL